MPRAPRRKLRRNKRRVAGRGGRKLRVARTFNPAPIFTESYKLMANSVNPYQLGPNDGGVLAVSMSQLPQLAQYEALYQKYRILKATFICIPQFNTMAADVNTPNTGASLASPILGLSRLVTAVNNTPDQIAPLSEDEILQDNGCKIMCGKPRIVLSCRPVANTQDANGNQMTIRGKYLNFVATNIVHYGIAWWHTQPVLPTGVGAGVGYSVYVKLTFQVSDPR